MLDYSPRFSSEGKGIIERVPSNDYFLKKDDAPEEKDEKTGKDARNDYVRASFTRPDLRLFQIGFGHSLS